MNIKKKEKGEKRQNERGEGKEGRREKGEEKNSIMTPDCNSDCKHYFVGYIEINV